MGLSRHRETNATLRCGGPARVGAAGGSERYGAATGVESTGERETDRFLTLAALTGFP